MTVDPKLRLFHQMTVTMEKVLHLCKATANNNTRANNLATHFGCSPAQESRRGHHNNAKYRGLYASGGESREDSRYAYAVVDLRQTRMLLR